MIVEEGEIRRDTIAVSFGHMDEFHYGPISHLSLTSCELHRARRHGPASLGALFVPIATP